MSERGHIARHAGTILIGQIAVMAFGVTDTLVASRYADTALAVLSIGGATFVTVYISLMGMLQALLPIWAELHGANHPVQLGRSVRQSLYLVLCLSAIGITTLYHPGWLLQWTQIPAELEPQVRDYLRIVALGLPGALLFRMFSTLNQSLGKPRWVTSIQVIALFLKIPLSIVLVMGWEGVVAPQGLIGCAWATFILNYVMIAMGLVLLKTQDFYQPYQFWRWIEKPQLEVLAQFLKLGIPSGLAIGVEVTSFTLMSLFIARLGVTATASHQIASNMTALLYMVPLSFSIATSARVSYWRGAQQAEQARQALTRGFQLVMSCALCMALIVTICRSDIAHFYSHTPAIAQLASVLLAWVCFYHLADALQVFCVFTLRSYRVTLLPLIIYTLCLWGVGLWGGYLVAYEGLGAWQPEWLIVNSPIAFWQTSAIALWFAALILGFVLWQQLRRSLQTPAL